RNRNTVAVLRVIQQVLLTQLVVERDQVGARQNRSTGALIVIETLQLHHEAELQRAVQEVGFREPQADIPHTRAELAFQRQGRAQPQELVRRIVEPDETARNAPPAAVQPPRVLAALFHLEGDV